MQIRSIFSYQYPIRQGSCTAGVALSYPLGRAGSARPYSAPKFLRR